MVGVVEWCYRKARDDFAKEDLFVTLDTMYVKCLDSFLLKKCDMSKEELYTLSMSDLLNVSPSKQYYVLLAHIYLIGIDNISEECISTYIDWMLLNPNEFETGLIAYIWYNSVYNNLNKYPTHSIALSILDSGCNFNTLSLLWRLAKANDIIACRCIQYISHYLGTPRYIGIVAYIYLSSKCSLKQLQDVCADIPFLDSVVLSACFKEFISYNWSLDVIESLLDKKCTLTDVFKYIHKHSVKGIPALGRRFPVDVLHSHVLKPKTRLKCLETLPSIPNTYLVDIGVWCGEARGTVVNNTPVNKYERWFSGLTSSQLDSLRSENPVVLQACLDKQWQYVEPILDSLMSREEYA